MNYPLAKTLRGYVEKKIHQFQPQPVLNSSDFPWTQLVDKSFPDIRAEALNVLERLNEIVNFNDVLPNQRALRQNENWKSFFLFSLKQEIPEHLELCPVTAKTLESIPGVINAFYSILTPGTQIPPHRGPYAGILRYHLGLIIPDGDCAIKVDGVECRWEEGGHLFFDDSFNHEAWNKTDGIRVILFVDLERPLPYSLGILNKVLLKVFSHSKAARQAQKNIENQILK